MQNENPSNIANQRAVEIQFREGEIALLTAFLSNLQTTYNTAGDILNGIKLISPETYINLPRHFGFMSNERLEAAFSEDGKVCEFKSSVAVHLKARIAFHRNLID